ncbi:VWA domain-containing protein [bacterium]|nr:VWA domain-containing protein [bacterium]
MISMMLQFTNYLRYEGFTVSTAALHNAIASLEWVNPVKKEQFYAAMEACLVQNIEDREKFSRYFRRFFEDKTPLAFEHQDASFRMQVAEFAKEIRIDGNYVSHIIADYIEGDVLGLMENIGDEIPFRPVYNDVASGSGMTKEQVRKEIIKRINLLVDEAEDFATVSYHMPRDKREALSDFLLERLKEAAALIKPDPFNKFGRRQLMPWEKQRTISTISFDKLALDEHEKVRAEVEKIAQKLKDALSRQKRRSSRGHIDIKNTIRKSMKYGGIPFKISMKTASRKKGKIVALCDISMSVAFAAQFMLLLLYRLQNRFSKIRSFVFIRNTFEISHFFTKHPLEVALQKAVQQHNIGMGQLTNYANSFKSFLDSYPNVINKDTTLLIMGDALNNHNDPKVEYLKKMAEKAARTIWLNPEEKQYWYSPSSAVSDYEPICTQMVECATIDQLSDFAKKLIL